MSSISDMNQPIKNILIVGGGTAGWMTAAAFAKILIPAGFNVRLVESEEIGTVGVGEATIPGIRNFNALLGIDEFEFLKRTQGTYKLGIEFINWGKLGESYMHPFGGVGLPRGPLSFYHYWHKYHLQGKSASIGDYCMSIAAAKQNKFMHPVAEANTPLNTINYAYHFDAGLYAKFLRNYAEQYGVLRIEGKINSIALDDSGAIGELTLASGEKLVADLYIDCTGFRGMLIEEALNTGFEDWGHLLLCDRAWAVQSEKSSTMRPYTQSIAHEAGWQWRIPLQSRVGNGHVYASRYMDDETAKTILLQNIEGKPITEPRLIKFKAGVRRKIWNKNCVAIGLSSGFLEPLESTSIHLIEMAIKRLVNVFPGGCLHQVDIDEFNRQMMDEYIFTRDFIVLHYKVNQRNDSDFWKFCQKLELPDELNRRIEMYASSGKVFISPFNIFREESWVCVMNGQGISPSGYHPVVNAMSDDDLERFMSSIRTAISSSLQSIPLHEAFVKKFCSAGN